MALSGIAPWLNPANPLAAMSEGANIGLHQAGLNQNAMLAFARMAQQDQQEQAANALRGIALRNQQNQAAQELELRRQGLSQNWRMGLMGLQEQERRAQEANAIRLDQINAANALELSQQKALENYRQQETAHRTVLEKNAEERLNLAKNPPVKDIHEPGVGIYHFNPDTGEWEQAAKFPDKTAKYSASRIKVNPEDGTIEEIQGDPNDPEIQKLMKNAQDKASAAAALEQNKPGIFSRAIDFLFKPAEANAAPAAALSATNTPTANPAGANVEPQKITTQEQFDALPRGAVYIGEDGKRYRKP